MKITKSMLKQIIKEEYQRAVEEMRDPPSDGFYSGGMEPFMAAASMPTASPALQASVDKLRETPAFKDSQAFKNYLSMSQIRDETALSLGNEIRDLESSIEQQYMKLISLSKKANASIPKK